MPHNAIPVSATLASQCGEMVCDSVPWHVLQTAPNHEASVFNAAAAAGFRCYWPRIAVRQRRYGRTETVLRAAFPSYLFVAFALTDAWGALLHLRDVKGLLRTSGGNPAAVRPGEVERLQALGRAGDGVIDDGATPFTPGDQVRLLSGPFADLTGICQWSTAERVAVLMSLLGRDVAIQVDRADVRAA